MRAVIQRVQRAAVRVDGQTVGEIGRGLLILLAVHKDDGEADLGWMLKKTAGLRIFPDGDGKMNLAATDVGAEALVVSQFTLYGDVRKGFRPSFVESAPPEPAEAMYARFVRELSVALGRPVPTGVFGADMAVELVNDGPVTIVLDSLAQ